MSRSFENNCAVTKVSSYAASAGTAINSSSVDMDGFEGVVFIYGACEDVEQPGLHVLVDLEGVVSPYKMINPCSIGKS